MLSLANSAVLDPYVKKHKKIIIYIGLYNVKQENRLLISTTAAQSQLDYI